MAELTPALSPFRAENLTTVQRPAEQLEDTSDQTLAIMAMESLAVRTVAADGVKEVYYEAADPGYKRAFTRDLSVAMRLRGDPEVLLSQVDYIARRLGTKQNPITGEEPGKPFHEEGGYIASETGLSTEFNACDTAAELLMDIAALAEQGDEQVLTDYAAAIDGCIGYIKRHVNAAGLFEEDPKYAGVTGSQGRDRRFALKVTDWKDSELNRADKAQRTPNYPIVYTLAHLQSAYALERMGRARKDERLSRYGRYMTEAGIQYLWRGDHFVTAIDMDGDIDAPSSDSLHALLYIPPAELPAGFARKIENYMSRLETAAGYRSGIPLAPDVDPYHMGVWVHEQALLHAAALRYGLSRPAAVARRVVPYIDPSAGFFPEVLDSQSLQLMNNANPRQLWAMAAFLYFQNPNQALL